MNKQAQGYHHTYLKTHNICLPTLSDFPTDASIQDAIDIAYKEAHFIWMELGFIYKVAMRTSTMSLPPIQDLLESLTPRNVHNIVGDNEDSDLDDGIKDDDGESDKDVDNGDSQHADIPIFKKTYDCRASSHLEATIVYFSVVCCSHIGYGEVM